MPTPRRSRLGPLIVLAAMAVGVLVADQLTKQWVVTTLDPHVPVPVIGEALIFQFVRNPGAAFSLASGMTWVFSLVAVGVGVVIIITARKLRSRAWAVTLGALLGGVLGNLTDRLLRPPGFGVGHVVDFIYTPWMLPAIYNVADIFIVGSVGLFLLLTLIDLPFDGTPRRRRGSRDAEVDAAAETKAATDGPDEGRASA